MIPKDKEGVTYLSEGSGRPFDMPERQPIEKNDEERQRKIIINLKDLNGDSRGTPKNFVRRAGRTLASFDSYWTQNETQGDDNDIQ